MTERDRLAFSVQFFILAEVYGEPVSETRLAAYFEALSDWTIEDLLEGMRRAMRTLKFFPKPVELIHQADEAREERYQAWLAHDRARHALTPGTKLALEPGGMKALKEAIGEVLREGGGAPA